MDLVTVLLGATVGLAAGSATRLFLPRLVAFVSNRMLDPAHTPDFEKDIHFNRDYARPEPPARAA